MYKEPTIIEINSLSVQASNVSRPDQILNPKDVTETMVANAIEARDILQTGFPENQVGISLHAGDVIDLNLFSNLSTENDLTVTSYDIPDIVTLQSTWEKFLRSPYLLKRIAWAANSTFGLTQSQAYEKHAQKMKALSEISSMQKPFVRMSVAQKDLTMHVIEEMPKKWTIALEYDPEDMALGEYFDLLKELSASNPHIGISMDLAHLAEYYVLCEGCSPQTAEKYVMKIYEGILKNGDIPMLSLDINNNPAEGFKHFGQTHKGIFGRGLFDMKNVVEMYEESDGKSRKRINIEFNPKDKGMLFLDCKGRIWLFDQLSAIKN